MDRRIPVCRERTGGLGEKQGEKEGMRRRETERKREREKERERERERMRQIERESAREKARERERERELTATDDMKALGDDGRDTSIEEIRLCCARSCTTFT